MLCVGGSGATEHTLRPDRDTEVNYPGHLISQGHGSSKERIEQRLLSPLRSLALSPIPHMEAEDHHYNSYMDLLLSNSDIYCSSRVASRANYLSKPYQGGTLPRGYKYHHKPSQGAKMTPDEDVYDIHPRRSNPNKERTHIYGSIPRTNNAHPPKRASS